MKNEYRKNTLRYRILCILILSSLLLNLLICFSCGYIYTKNINAEYACTSSGIANAVADMIDGNDIEAWLAGTKNTEYEVAIKKLAAIKASVLDVKHLQVYCMNADGMTAIFNVDNYITGDKVNYPEAFEGIRNRLIGGKKVEPILTDDKTDIVSFVVIEDSQAPAYAICRMDASRMCKERNDFLKIIFWVNALISIILVIITNIYMNHILITPFNEIDAKLRRFADDNTIGDEIKSGLEKINDHNIKEIYEMKKNFSILCDEIGIKTNEIKEIDQKIMDRMKSVLEDLD